MDPIDRYNIVFGILLINGIGTLLPWNMFINADSYFVDYKLNVSHTGSDSLVNYRTNFLSYLGIASISPNVFLQILNLFANKSYGSLSTRISLSLLLQSVIFVATIVLAVLDTTGWPDVFFWLTMLSAVIINSATGVLQGCNYGAAAKLPMKYTNAVVMGTNLSGTIVSIFMLASLALSPTPRAVGIVYFALALVVIVVCLISQFFLKNNNFYIYYTEKDGKSEAIGESHDMSDQPVEGPDITGLVLYKHVLLKTWPQLLNIFITYFSTLCIFPALMAAIQPLNHMISDMYFVPTFCFLFFNLFVTIGNYLAQMVQKPGPKYLFIFCVLRLLFIPYFLLCNYRPENINRKLIVIFGSDWYYIWGVIFMSLSFGYLSSLGMMYAPRFVHSKHKSTAGMMSGLALIIGIFVGVNSSLLHPILIQT